MPINGTQVPFRSLLERDFLLRRTLSSIVQEIVAQPVQIPFTGRDGEQSVYTPEFLVHYRSETYSWAHGPRPMLVSVTSQDVLRDQWPLLKPKFKAARRYAKAQGWDFNIHDEDRICDCVLDNTSFLARYRSMAFDSADSAWMCEFLRLRGEISVDHLVASLFASFTGRATGIAQLWHLVATGEIQCDLEWPLCNTSRVWIQGS